jgi:mitosis inhibitor protein kinase SWE1
MRFNSPKTPKDSIVPPDPSSLSISGKVYNYNPVPHNKRNSLPSNPVTPARDFSHFNFGRESSPSFPDSFITEDGMSLYSKFSEVKHIGTGEFSEVYRVTEKSGRSYGQLFTPGRSSESGFSSSPVEHKSVIPNVYAVKKAKNRFLGPRDRRERMQEVQILKELGKHEHIVSYVDHWMDDGGYLCIQTEFCENGSLDKFLEQHGTKGRLDEFRVWKMLLELCLVGPTILCSFQTAC